MAMVIYNIFNYRAVRTITNLLIVVVLSEADHAHQHMFLLRPLNRLGELLFALNLDYRFYRLFKFLLADKN